MDAMDAIGDDYVEKIFNNEGFVKFILDNARMVTHIHTQSLDQIKDDPENWFAKFHPIDKAYSVTQRVNNERVWAWTYKEKKRENVNKSADETTKKLGEDGKVASQRVPTTRNANKTKKNKKQSKKKN